MFLNFKIKVISGYMRRIEQFLFFFFSGQSKLLVSSKELRFEAPQNKVTSHELVYSVQLNCQMSSIFSDKES
jgi:hypothetical protein